MGDAFLVVPFIPEDSIDVTSLLDEWAILEQADIPNSASEAKVSDVYSMIGYAKAGMTSLDYIGENCSSISVIGGIVHIRLDFYVWVSSTDIEYTLESSNPNVSIGTATVHTAATSFNVIFNNTQAVDLGRLFTGSLAAEMPFFNSDGSTIHPSPTIEMIGTNAVLSEKATTVLRANGTVNGYKHTMTLKLDPTSADYVTTDLNLYVTAQWGVCDSSDAYCLESNRDTLLMEIPACVEELLNSCGTDLPSTLEDDGTWDVTGGRQMVYYSTCSGQVLLQYWKANDE